MESYKEYTPEDLLVRNKMSEATTLEEFFDLCSRLEDHLLPIQERIVEELSNSMPSGHPVFSYVNLEVEKAKKVIDNFFSNSDLCWNKKSDMEDMSCWTRVLARHKKIHTLNCFLENEKVKKNRFLSDPLLWSIYGWNSSMGATLALKNECNGFLEDFKESCDVLLSKSAGLGEKRDAAYRIAFEWHMDKASAAGEFLLNARDSHQSKGREAIEEGIAAVKILFEPSPLNLSFEGTKEFWISDKWGKINEGLCSAMHVLAHPQHASSFADKRCAADFLQRQGNFLHLISLARTTKDITTFLAIAEVLPKDSLRQAIKDFVPLEEKSSDQAFHHREQRRPLVRTAVEESNIVKARESKLMEVHLATQRLVAGDEERVVERLFIDCAARGEDERAAALLGGLLLQNSPFKSATSLRECCLGLEKQKCCWGGLYKLGDSARIVVTRFKTSAQTKLIASTVAERVLEERISHWR